MSARNGVRRYVLVPQSDAAEPGGPGVRRYRLAHLGGSPRGALGEDRHERLERAAGLVSTGASNGTGQPSNGTGQPSNGTGQNGSPPAVEEEELGAETELDGTRRPAPGVGSAPNAR